MSKVAYLYKTDKVFRKLFNLMFNDFGWDATQIDEDILKIWAIIPKIKSKKKVSPHNKG